MKAILSALRRLWRLLLKINGEISRRQTDYDLHFYEEGLDWLDFLVVALPLLLAILIFVLLYFL